jgi:RNA polymerase sigma-70 factor (ECF subfamily)
MKGDEDISYVKRFKNGDEKAFDELFEKYQGSLYSICYRFSRNDADARDLTQEVFIKIYNNLKKFNEKSKFFTWVHRIAVNTCISFKRKEHNIQPNYSSASISMDEKVRMKIAIDDALAKLPKRQRMSFILHHYEGYTFSEVGGLMKISSGAAKANHYQAIKKLRILLKDWL